MLTETIPSHDRVSDAIVLERGRAFGSPSLVKTRSFLSMTVGLHVCLLVWAIVTSGPTIDEPPHLMAGLSNWQTGRFDVYHVNPPLVRMVASFPVLWMNPVTDWSNAVPFGATRTEFRLGAQFVHDNGPICELYFIIARLCCMPFSVFGLVVCYKWASVAFGSRSGLLAALMWATSPMILGHGALITADVASASFGIATMYSLRCWALRPTFQNSVLVGCVAGMALLTKFTWAIVLPVTGALTLAIVLSTQSPRHMRKTTATCLLAVGGSLLVVNLGYGFERSFTCLGDYEFYSQALTGEAREAPELLSDEDLTDGAGNRFSGSVLHNLPIPLPYHYLAGIDTQKIDFEPGTNNGSYLAGVSQRAGWWYYYFVAAAVKLPLPTICLGILFGIASLAGIVRLLRKHRLSNEDNANSDTVFDYVLLLSPIVLLTAVLSSQHLFTNHFRYALPVFPFVFVLSSGVMRVQSRWSIRRAAVALAVWQVAIVFWHGPHWLSYFNEIAGGSRNGYKWLSGSNVDWGHGLLGLRDWQQDHHDRTPLFFVGSTPFCPADLGIEATVPKPFPISQSIPQGIKAVFRGGHDISRQPRFGAAAPSTLQPGWHAVSVQALTGECFAAYDEVGHQTVFYDQYMGYRNLAPVDWIGNSIQIFYVPEERNYNAYEP